MRTKVTILAVSTAVGLLVPAGIAVAHEPGKACESNGAAARQNPHCSPGHGDAVPGARRGGHHRHDPDGDNIRSGADNCPKVFNPRQTNVGELPRDRHGNACDHSNDVTGDGECDVRCRHVATITRPGAPRGGYATDSDGDGISDQDEDLATPRDLRVPA